MKKILLFVILVAKVSMSFGQMQDTNEGAVIRFLDLIYDYGELQLNDFADCTFEFRNDGNQPLIIDNAKSSCGCTDPVWKRKPLMPGERGVITVKFHALHVGEFHKTVVVYSNAVNTPHSVLRIKGTVVKKTTNIAKPNNLKVTKQTKNIRNVNLIVVIPLLFFCYLLSLLKYDQSKRNIQKNGDFGSRNSLTNQMALSTRDLPKGMYFVTLTTPQGSNTQKLVVE